MSQISIAARNAELLAHETTVGASPRLRLFTGTMPANCAAASTGTLLAEIVLPADWLGAPANGSASVLGLPVSDSAADAAGLAGYARLFDAAGSVCHRQMLISQPWAASVAVQIGQQMHNGPGIYRCTTAGTTASSGGPTGTGASIADGTTVWAYVAAGPEMVIDNGVLAAGQEVRLNSFTITQGGA